MISFIKNLFKKKTIVNTTSTNIENSPFAVKKLQIKSIASDKTSINTFINIKPVDKLIINNTNIPQPKLIDEIPTLTPIKRSKAIALSINLLNYLQQKFPQITIYIDPRHDEFVFITNNKQERIKTYLFENHPDETIYRVHNFIERNQLNSTNTCKSISTTDGLTQIYEPINLINGLTHYLNSNMYGCQEDKSNENN